jgi:hypothetical protein
MQRRIHVDGERVTGAVTLTSPKPIIAAAAALKAADAADSDTIVCSCPSVTVSPITVGAALGFRPTKDRIRLMKTMCGANPHGLL